MKTFLTIAVTTSAIALLGAAVPASAQDDSVAVPTEAVPSGCELHVFPSTEGQASTTGWLSGLGIVGAIADGAVNKDRNISEAEYLKEALGPRLQVEALQSADLLGSLKLPPAQIIYEEPISDRKITTKAATRLSSSVAPCYMELLVTQNFYTKKAIYGRSLNNRFIFKDFRDGKNETKMIKGRGGNGLSSFPPKTTDETEAAEQELREVFVKNFEEFAKGVDTQG
ncbi:hypothetical protein [Novosphingopyxis sp.]|uniref:hypothetical protein n=1 Tax=Novosphingopyxis sp. TaxID=2709690 RepID=UPI003B5949CB